MSGFDGRVCVVTGAGAGIGRALTLALARRGARLAISDLDEDGLAETAALAERHGAEVHATRLDVADREAFTAYADEVVARFGTVNQVYNNAGIWLARSILDSSFEDFERLWSIDLWGVVHGTKLFLPHLIASGEGHVINVSSINGILAQADTSHYCSAKFAVRGFTESLRLELEASGHPVRALTVHPGGVHTGIASTALRYALENGEELSERDVRLEKLYNNLILRLDPDKAAESILKAVAKDRTRVLVGNDAKLIDLTVRVAPSFVLGVSGKVLKRLWR
ncbi:MAG: SDR family NAD(P)-dependent oxidoreductase [Solirubrobacteraceae bacterium]|nr:SDR family NAD(P)-dependent oxidoreductase [Solirubrobacteraceae bacterium]